MAAKRGGKSPVDWEAAFGYYAALPPAERTYAAVGARFKVSVRTVETHGRRDGWKQRLHTIDAETAARTTNALVTARVEEVHKLRRLIDASFIAYAERLRDGMRMNPGDLERLNRLSVALIDEAANPHLDPRVDNDDAQTRTPEHAVAVLDALAESGALGALGLTRIENPKQLNAKPEQEGDDDDQPTAANGD